MKSTKRRRKALQNGTDLIVRNIPVALSDNMYKILVYHIVRAMSVCSKPRTAFKYLVLL